MQNYALGNEVRWQAGSTTTSTCRLLDRFDIQHSAVAKYRRQIAPSITNLRFIAAEAELQQFSGQPITRASFVKSISLGEINLNARPVA